MTDRLEIQAPVYIMFTKADLISGFSEFFEDMAAQERDRVWGATLPYQPEESTELLPQFDQRFEEPLRWPEEMSRTRIAIRRSGGIPPSLLSFPQEFYSLKPALRSFIATLSTSIRISTSPSSGVSISAAPGRKDRRTAPRRPHRAAIRPVRGAAERRRPSRRPQRLLPARPVRRRSFRRPGIGAPASLSGQDTPPLRRLLRDGGRLRPGIGGWTWSYQGNRQLADHVRADLDQIVALEKSQGDLQSRLHALEILQDRIMQLDRYGNASRLSVGLGLYQGDRLRRQLLSEYYHGVHQLMLAPIQRNLESFLSKVEFDPNGRKTAETADGSSAANAPPHEETLFQDADPGNPQDAYNALKTYLMLSDRQHAEPVHLADQLARYWRTWLEENRGTMPRAELIRSAEREISFYASLYRDPDWSQADINLALVEKTRQALRAVMRGMPAQERAYATIKARAATRFAPMTVSAIIGDRDQGLIAGSYAVPGAFTREAWTQYIHDAIREAANHELHTTDWVLGVSAHDDLTLEGSPEQIEKALTTTYKKEYAEHWNRFLRGIAVKPFAGFKQAVQAMNRLGDPEISPIAKLVRSAYTQTSWDNPLPTVPDKPEKPGMIDRIFGHGEAAAASAAVAQVPMGPLARQFSDVARLVAMHDKQSLLGVYMDALSRIRTRFNALDNQGDPGPGALALMRQTLEGRQSELADALQVVDGQMLTGMEDAQRQALRPLLAGPLVRAYDAIVAPAGGELNKVWKAQVYLPFTQSLARKYPLPNTRASKPRPPKSADIRTGREHRAVCQRVGRPLAVRRGNLPGGAHLGRPWRGIQSGPHGELRAMGGPFVRSGFRRGGLDASNAVPDPAAARARRDGIHHRNRRPAVPIPQYAGAMGELRVAVRERHPGARITATLYDGSVIDVVNEPGRFGPQRLIDSATRKTNPDKSFDMSWSKSGITVSVALRIISDAQAAAGGQTGQGLRNPSLPDAVAVMPSAPSAPKSGDTQR